MPNRPIKFRAWDGKKMYEWSDVRHGDFDIENFFYPDQENWHVMQFTGLTDKNGKEIYEGDVVEIVPVYSADELAPQRATVEYAKPERNRMGFVFEYIDHKGFDEQGSPNFQTEVIGNIYENPNLLNHG